MLSGPASTAADTNLAWLSRLEFCLLVCLRFLYSSESFPSVFFLPAPLPLCLDPSGMAVTAIDTPGLHASADAQSANRSLLKAIKGAWKKHKPNFLVYVDRWVGVRLCAPHSVCAW